MRLVTVSCVLLLAALPLAAQETHYFLPVLSATEASDLGLALLNSTSDEVFVTLTARDYSGSLIAGDAIVNPATIRISAGGQAALRTSEMFGPGLRGKAGSVDIAVPNGAIKGFFLLFDSALTFIDGAELLDHPSRRLIFQRVSSDSSLASTLTFLNTTSLTLSNVTLTLPGTNFRKVFDIGPHAGFSGSLKALIPDVQFYDGYAVLELPPNAAEALVGMSTYKRNTDIAVLPAAIDSSRLRTGNGFFSAGRTFYITTKSGISVGGFILVGDFTTPQAQVSVGRETVIDLSGPGVDRIRGLRVPNDPTITITGSPAGPDRYRCTFAAAPDALAGINSLVIETDEGDYPASGLLVGVYAPDVAGIAPFTFRPDTALANATTHVTIFIYGSAFTTTGFYFLKSGLYDPALLVTGFKQTNSSTFEADVTIARGAEAGDRTLAVMTTQGVVKSRTRLVVTTAPR